MSAYDRLFELLLELFEDEEKAEEFLRLLCYVVEDTCECECGER